MYFNHILQPFMKILLTWYITAYHKNVYFLLTHGIEQTLTQIVNPMILPLLSKILS